MIIALAWRNIWRNKIRSLIIMSSVALGLLAGLFVLSLYKGIIADRIHTVIQTEVAHLQIHHPRFKEDIDPKYVVAAEELPARLGTMASVSSFTLRTVCQGMLATGTGASGIQITGVDPYTENIVSQLNTKIVEGDGFKTEKKNPLIIGKRLAEKMHLRLNSKAILTFTDRESNIISAAFRIAGIYQTDNAPRDEGIAFVRQEDLNALLSLGNEFHEVAIILNDDNELEKVKAQLIQTFSGLLVESWKDISPETKLMIDTTDQYSHIFIFIIVFALSFGIVNTMLMAVLERSREIGMLLALGMNRIKIFSMILTETFFLTLSGVPAGVFLTWLVVSLYHHRGLDISAIGGEAMSAFGFSTMIYPAFPWEKLITEMMIVMVAALASSLFPAIKAIRLTPVDALQK